MCSKEILVIIVAVTCDTYVGLGMYTLDMISLFPLGGIIVEVVSFFVAYVNNSGPLCRIFFFSPNKVFLAFL